VIRNIEAYRQNSEAEYWQDLARMSIEDTIKLGEALLTSEIFDARKFSDDDHPMSLARSLGIARKAP
jgi:hypothetical protein